MMRTTFLSAWLVPRATLFAFIGAACTAAWAQESPQAVTMPQVAGYQWGFQSSCERAAQLHGVKQSSIVGYCECVMTVYRFNATLTDWQAAYFYSANGRYDEEAKVLATYKAKLARCPLPAPATSKSIASARH